MKTIVKHAPPGAKPSLQLTVSFEESDLQVRETPFGVVLDLKEGAVAGPFGGPAIPACNVQVVLPPFTRPLKVTPKVLRTVEVTGPATLIAPHQPPQPAAPPEPPPGFAIKPSSLQQPAATSSSPGDQAEWTPPVEKLYRQAVRKPPPAARLLGFEEAALSPVARIEINPLRQRQDGVVEFSPEIEVTIDYARVKSARPGGGYARPVQSRAQAERMMAQLRGQVTNPEDIVETRDAFPWPAPGAAYLIITDDHTWDAKTIQPVAPVDGVVAAFKKLLAWKEQRGLTARLVTVADIVRGVYGDFATGARDLQEVLRNFIKFAHAKWGTAWLLLGGDLAIIPVRTVASGCRGDMRDQSTNPPPANTSYWTGSFLKMHARNPGEWFSASTSNILTRADDGKVIPYDAAGTSGPAQPGWYFTTDDSYGTRAAWATSYVRVNGPAATARGTLRWLYEYNTIPTDLYYASLTGPNYGLAGKHDWDLLDNGVYGQNSDTQNWDGQEYHADLSVGRAAVETAAEAQAFVDKVIAYEKYVAADGTPLDADWPTTMLLVSADWSSSTWISPSGIYPPPNGSFYKLPGEDRTLVKLSQQPTVVDWNLIAQLPGPELCLVPFDAQGTGAMGWYFARSGTDHTPNGTSMPVPWPPFNVWVPAASQWLIVFGAGLHLTPNSYIWDSGSQDGSMSDQEQLRGLIAAELPRINKVSRLYEDMADLTPAQAAAGPVDFLTAPHLQDALNAAPHFVSLSGHGSSDGCCDLSRSMANALTNAGRPFVGYADSCLTNEFVVQDAVSEVLTKKAEGGAVAYAGSSRFSWIGLGDDVMRAFFHQRTITRHLGTLFDSRFALLPGAWGAYGKWIACSLNLIGDPEMPVWVGPVLRLKVEIRRPRPRQAWEFKLYADGDSDTELPLTGVIVHLKQARASYRFEPARESLPFVPGARLVDTQVTVTKPDYAPLVTTMRLPKLLPQFG